MPPLLANTTEKDTCICDVNIPLDELYRLKGFIHVTDSQVEAEVEHGVTSGLLTVLQTYKVSKSFPGHHMRDLGGRPCRWLGSV